LEHAESNTTLKELYIMRETVYYQRGAADPVLEDNLVLDIVRQYAPSAKAVVSINDTHGEARAYMVDETNVLKVQRPQQLRSSTGLEKEAFFLKQLEQQTDVSVPRVLGYGKRGTVEYICMTRIPGIAAEHARLTVKEKNILLPELGKELRKIHGIDQRPILGSGLFPCDDPADLTERLRRRYQSAIRQRAANTNNVKLEYALNEVEKALQTIKDTDTFIALHVNPYTPHVFVDERTHKYSGIIDFGDAYIGHPIFDMWYWNAKSRKVLLKGYTSEKPVSVAFQVIFDAVDTISGIIKDMD